jgi:hypothetical protein
MANAPDAWNWLHPKSTSGIPGGLRTTSVEVNLLSRQILIQFRSAAAVFVQTAQTNGKFML